MTPILNISLKALASFSYSGEKAWHWQWPYQRV
jgi:hypothetical protein